MQKLSILFLFCYFSCQHIGIAQCFCAEPKAYGSDAFDIGISLEADENGNVYQIGRFMSNQITFGTHTLNRVGPGSNYFLIKYDAAGNVVWAKNFIGGNSGESDWNKNITIDHQGDVIVCGHSNLSIGGTQPWIGIPRGMFVAKINKNNGDFIWVRSAGSDNLINGKSVAVDESDNVYLVGNYWGTSAIFDNDTLFRTIDFSTTNINIREGFLAKYSSSGNLIWTHQIHGVYPKGIVIDSHNKIYIVGRMFTDTLTLGALFLQRIGTYDMFYGKADTSGNFEWVSNIGVTSYQVDAETITKDNDNNIYISGSSQSPTIDFGGIIINNTLQGNNAYLVKFDSTGYPVAGRCFGNTLGFAPESIKIGENKSVYLTGEYVGPSINFDGYILQNQISTQGYYNSNIVVVKLDSLLQTSCAIEIGGDEKEYGTSIALDNNENIYITGSFDSRKIQFGLQTILNVDTNQVYNDNDILIVKFKLNDLSGDLGADTLVCLGQSLPLNANFGNSSYLWSTGDSLQSISVNSPGSYSVIVYNQEGCYFKDTINISYFDNNVNLGNDTMICAGDQLILNIPLSNSTFQWQNGSADSTQVVNGPGTYWVSTQNFCGTKNDTITITHLDPPLVSLSEDTSMCPGTIIILNATSTYANYYLWQDNTTNQTYSVTMPGTYWIQAINNCGESVDSITISQLNIPHVDLGPDTLLCASSTITLNAGNQLVSYLWQNNTIDSVFIVNTPGKYWVTVSNVCETISDTILIENLETPKIQLINDTSICLGSSLTLNATFSHCNYLWQDGSTLPTILVTNSGLYWVQANNLCGSDYDSVSIVNIHLPTVYLGMDTSICPQSTIVLNAAYANSSYFWQDGSLDSSHLVNSTGIYWVKVRNKCGESVDSISIGNLVLNLGNDTTICNGESLILNPSVPSAIYQWQDNSNDSIYFVWTTGTYSVQTDLCFLRDSIHIEVINCEINSPNIFSPNNDGKNDEFNVPIHPSRGKAIGLYIYNRWGLPVYESIDAINGWNGKTEGKNCDDGTYFWILNYIDAGEIKNLSGFLTLVR